MRLALVFSLMAGPAAAGCFAADGMPEKAIYDGGIELFYEGREGDVLTYRVGQMVTRIKDGLWPLDHRLGEFVTEYRWAGEVPDLAAVIAAGGTAQVEGTMKQGGNAPVEVVAEVEVLGEDSIDWEDCRYSVVEIGKTIRAGDKVLSEGVVIYAPDAMISFRSSSVDPVSRGVTVLELQALE
jgi:hypothetical protein